MRSLCFHTSANSERVCVCVCVWLQVDPVSDWRLFCSAHAHGSLVERLGHAAQLEVCCMYWVISKSDWVLSCCMMWGWVTKGNYRCFRSVWNSMVFRFPTGFSKLQISDLSVLILKGIRSQ